MAITLEFGALKVSRPQEKLYLVTIPMTVKDGVDVVFQKEYSVHIRKKQDIAGATKEFITLMQQDVNRYEEEVGIKDLPEFVAMMAEIQAKVKP
jgi:hypothetical protein